MTEDQIRFKNLMSRAIDIAKNRDDGREFATELSRQRDQLLSDQGFWEDQTEGLLICMRPGLTRMFHLPIDTEEYVAVSNHFHLAPIFGVLQDMCEYYVLTVTQHQPQLFRGDFYDLQTTDIDLPATAEQGLNIDEMNVKTENQGSARGSSLNTSWFNGRGGAKNPAEEDRLRFWRMIDQIITSKADTKLPLILAGTDSEHAEYRSISHYPKILEHGINGSYSGNNPHELFPLAMDIIRKELLNPTHDAIIEEYERAKGQAPDQAAREVAAIADAAGQGRIDKLLLAGVRFTTDTVRDNNEPVPVLTFPPEESAQAVQDIAYEVWNTSGQIIDIEADHMPEPGALMLATLRY